jgi:hypothetical protein
VTVCAFLPHTAATADRLGLIMETACTRVRVCVCVYRRYVTESYMHLSKNYYPAKTKLQGSQKHIAIAILKRYSEFPRCLKLHKAGDKRRCSMAGCVTTLLTFKLAKRRNSNSRSNCHVSQTNTVVNMACSTRSIQNRT